MLLSLLFEQPMFTWLALLRFQLKVVSWFILVLLERLYGLLDPLTAADELFIELQLGRDHYLLSCCRQPHHSAQGVEQLRELWRQVFVLFVLFHFGNNSGVDDSFGLWHGAIEVLEQVRLQGGDEFREEGVVESLIFSSWKSTVYRH